MTITLARPQTVGVDRPAAKRQRLVLLDAARLVAAIAIVWLHVPRSEALIPTTAFGRFAVPFFVATAVFFVIQSLFEGRGRTLPEYARNRVVRLYVPFLAWTAIYLLFKLVKHVLAPNQPNDFPGLTAIVTGGFYHLWFLPFVLLVTLATYAVGRKVIGNELAESRFALIAATVGTSIAIAPIPRELATWGPLAEYGWMTLPAVFWAATLAIVYRRGGSQCIQNQWTTLTGLVLTVVATAWTWHVGRSMIAENLSGLGFLIFALGTWDGSWVRRIATLGPLAYGIYLSHLLFVKTAEAVATKLKQPETVLFDLATFAIAALGSTALAWLLSRLRYTRWLVV